MLNQKSIRNFVAGVLCLFGGVVLAGDADFTLTNRTGYVIESVYVSPSGAKTWGRDRLGDFVLENGRSKFLKFSKSGSVCIYDILVKWEDFDDSESRIWNSIDLCSINKITLRYNRNTDIATAVFD